MTDEEERALAEYLRARDARQGLPCEECGRRKRRPGLKLCWPCQLWILRRMTEDGYLTPDPPAIRRDAGAKENQQETKRGSGHG